MYLIPMAEKTRESFATGFAVRDKLREPENYKVILYNDDYTTKDFVVAVLKGIFQKSDSESIALMETVHRSGKAGVGVYCYDIAVTKTEQVKQHARANGFPLKCGLEKA